MSSLDPSWRIVPVNRLACTFCMIWFWLYHMTRIFNTNSKQTLIISDWCIFENLELEIKRCKGLSMPSFYWPRDRAGPLIEHSFHHYMYFDIDAIARTQRLYVNLVSGNFVLTPFRPIYFVVCSLVVIARGSQVAYPGCFRGRNLYLRPINTNHT